MERRQQTSDEIDQVLYGRARWRLRFLVPLWSASVLLLMALMGSFAYRLAETVENWEDTGKKGGLPQVELAWECTNVGFSLLSFICTTIEISRLVSETLTPFLMMCSQIVKLTLSFAILGLDIAVFMQRNEGVFTVVGLAVDCALLVVTLATFFYALSTFRRLLKFEEYHRREHLVMASHYGNVDGVAGGPDARQKYMLSGGNGEYPSQTSHLRSAVDQAIDAEFGWSRSDSVVGKGTVHRDRATMAMAAPVPEGEEPSGRYDDPDDHHSHDHDDDDHLARQNFGRHAAGGASAGHGGDDEDEDDQRALLGDAADLGVQPLSLPQRDLHRTGLETSAYGGEEEEATELPPR